MTSLVAKTVTAAVIGLVMLEAGCSRAPALSPRAAAQLAAAMANQVCDSLYQERPFNASQHLAILRKGRYEWGRFDPAGPGGFSALVQFRADGSSPHIEIYFSCDPPRAPLRPRLPLPPNGNFPPRP